MNRITRHIRNGGSTARTLGPARPYRDSDPLTSLPYHRARFIRQRAAGHELGLTEYGWLLQLAMKPARLPKYRTPVEVEADRDAAIAIHYHNAAMQHFCKALGIAA